MKTCLLEGCNKPARRKFCCNKHKDKYHNIHNPRGKYAHLKSITTDGYDPDDDLHPFSSEALGQA